MLGFGVWFWVLGFWSWLRVLGFRVLGLVKRFGFRVLGFGLGFWV